jgi:hypothetical protein
MRGESTLNIEYSPDGKKEKKIYIMAIQIYNTMQWQTLQVVSWLFQRRFFRN